MAASDTLPSSDLDTWLDRMHAGERLSDDELTRLADLPDILPAGMLADAVRRRVKGTRVTFLRVALVDATKPVVPATVSEVAKEVRLTGSPDTLGAAIDAVTATAALANGRLLSGFSLADVDRWARDNGGHVAVLRQLRAAGLDTVAEIPLDGDETPERGVADLIEAGLQAMRLTVTRPAATGARLQHLLRASALCERFPQISVVAPLPLAMAVVRPTTGYDDVKAVALARLALPHISCIQVDWLRYGPKLAQVVLTFGADDLDNVSPEIAAPDGHRRAVVEELRKNVESAGFSAVERDGRFVTVS